MSESTKCYLKTLCSGMPIASLQITDYEYGVTGWGFCRMNYCSFADPCFQTHADEFSLNVNTASAFCLIFLVYQIHTVLS